MVFLDNRALSKQGQDPISDHSIAQDVPNMNRTHNHVDVAAADTRWSFSVLLFL